MQEKYYRIFNQLAIVAGRISPVAILNRLGLVACFSASLYLTAAFFLTISNNLINALVFLCIGLAAEIGKYAAVYTAKDLKGRGKWWTSRLCWLVVLVLVTVSILASMGALLKKDTATSSKISSYQAQIADIDRSIAEEQKVLLRASTVNAQTAGVIPAREAIDQLRKEKAELLNKQAAVPVQQSQFLVLASALSARFQLSQSEAEYRLSLSISSLLEGLCLFFALVNRKQKKTSITERNSETERNEDSGTLVPMGVTDGTVTETKENVIDISQHNKQKLDTVFKVGTDQNIDTEIQRLCDYQLYEQLVMDFKAGKESPTFTTISKRLGISRRRVKDVKQVMVKQGIIKEDNKGRAFVC